MHVTESGPVIINPFLNQEKASLFDLLRRKKPEDETVPSLLLTRKVSRIANRTYYNGCLYEGEYNEAGNPHGQGKIRSQYSSFTGQVVNGVRHGIGVMIAGNESYEGNFENDLYHGFGKLKIENIGVYEGFFQQGKFHGQGEFTWFDGTVYEGSFFEDASEGQGELRFVDGRKYQGQFKGNFPHGKGSLLFPNGLECRGDFCLGKFHGRDCKIFYPNGDIYVGEVVEGRREGKGSMIKLDCRIDGIWQNDTFFTGTINKG